MTRRRISHRDLPKAAWKKISAAQKSYIDEFKFYERTNGDIEAWYAGELLAVWNGKGWV